MKQYIRRHGLVSLLGAAVLMALVLFLGRTPPP